MKGTMLRYYGEQNVCLHGGQHLWSLQKTARQKSDKKNQQANRNIITTCDIQPMSIRK